VAFGDILVWALGVMVRNEQYICNGVRGTKEPARRQTHRYAVFVIYLVSSQDVVSDVAKTYTPLGLLPSLWTCCKLVDVSYFQHVHMMRICCRRLNNKL